MSLWLPMGGRGVPERRVWGVGGLRRLSKEESERRALSTWASRCFSSPPPPRLVDLSRSHEICLSLGRSPRGWTHPPWSLPARGGEGARWLSRPPGKRRLAAWAWDEFRHLLPAGTAGQDAVSRRVLCFECVYVCFHVCVPAPHPWSLTHCVEGTELTTRDGQLQVRLQRRRPGHPGPGGQGWVVVVAGFAFVVVC